MQRGFPLTALQGRWGCSFCDLRRPAIVMCLRGARATCRLHTGHAVDHWSRLSWREPWAAGWIPRRRRWCQPRRWQDRTSTAARFRGFTPIHPAAARSSSGISKIIDLNPKANVCGVNSLNEKLSTVTRALQQYGAPATVRCSCRSLTTFMC